MSNSLIRILGLDPGLKHTGWGVIESHGQSLSFVAAGVVNPPCNDQPLSLRLAYLFEALKKIVETWCPDEAAVEEIFVNKNPASALKLGMARGVVLMTPCVLKVPVFSYSANMVKKSVVGVGHADKVQVQMMVRHFLPRMQEKLTMDATDALAVAICHCHHRKIATLTQTLRS